MHIDPATTFEPNVKQAAMLECARQAGLNRNVSKLCQEANISRTSFKRWMKTDGFRRAWEELPKAMILDHMPGIVAAMVKRALAGEVGAAKVLLTMAGEIQTIMNVTYQHEIIRPTTYDEWLVYNLAQQQNLDPAGAIGELKRLTHEGPTNGEIVTNGNGTGKPN